MADEEFADACEAEGEAGEELGEDMGDDMGEAVGEEAVEGDAEDLVPWISLGGEGGGGGRYCFASTPPPPLGRSRLRRALATPSCLPQS